MAEYMTEKVIPSLHAKVAAKQDKLVSGESIKTLNGESLLGEGDITIKELPAFTNEKTGSILGSEKDGYVNAQEDGTGQVNGYQNLKLMVQQVENPDIPTEKVATKEALDAVDTTGFTGGEIYEVTVDESHDGQTSIYEWNAETSSWDYKGKASPYATKAELNATLGEVNNQLESI